MIDLLKRRLSVFQPSSLDGRERMRASVLIPVLLKDGEIQILLTKRTETVKYHKGEISFPGGTYEEGDGDALTTAIRESMEEIGVRPDDVEILGRLSDTNTFTGFVITPYVGIIPFPYDFALSSAEVDYIIYLPLSYLMTSEYRIEPAELMGKNLQAPAIYYEGERIWGATCRMLLQLRRLLEDEKI
jgi:8-oxo-dGTP pyrophosphatase MutT (NUDIX family)